MGFSCRLQPRLGRVRESAAVLLFFGALAQQPQLQQAGTQALAELAAAGYRVPLAAEPVRVFPALTGGDFSGRHAGGWRPGAIYLRPSPEGGHEATVYLRHELFHEVSRLSCGGRLPLWAEEAGALWFSGELVGAAASPVVSEAELQELKERVRQGTALPSPARQTLGRLLADFGWPAEPCAVSAQLAELLGTPFDDPGAAAYLLASVVSGRVLEAGGDLRGRYPPGSLLKIPYAAALNQESPEDIAAELLASDTARLLARRGRFDPQRYRLLLVAAPGVEPPAVAAVTAPAAEWSVLLGERDGDGRYPLQLDLRQLARVLRAALLARPDYFRGLSRNGEAAASTLAAQPEADKQVLRDLNALAKTGTASDGRGTPLVGNLLVAWPAPHPVLLALFRQRGSSGAGLLPRASPWLRRWQQTHPVRTAAVRVRLLSLTERSSWQALEECPAFDSGDARISLCGSFRLLSAARGSRSERRVDGVLYRQREGAAVVLETDGESYADAVLQAEAQELTGSARAALRAVILWNAAHGRHRHGDTDSLCDTTHCMVFLGAPEPGRSLPATEPGLVTLLDRLARQQGLDWLGFAAGGSDRWERSLAAADLAQRLGENQILDLRRERRKDGAVALHLIYPEGEEVVSCEVFRNRLKLPSCPDAVGYDSAGSVWIFRGIGAGHGNGLQVARAKALSEAGRSAAEILRDAYVAAAPPP